MANFTYFFDSADTAIELVSVTTIDNAAFQKQWPGVKGVKDDGYSMRVGICAKGVQYPITRAIEMKRNPSNHQCNAKCLNGSHRGVCECQCGGKNHGRGMFTSLVAA